MSTKREMEAIQKVAERATSRKVDPSRHKCFVSYRVTDRDEVEGFLDDFGAEFIPRSVGVTEEDDFINSSDSEYIKRRIREEYLTDSTVTIVLLGACTWSRKFVDWEISSSLRHDSKNRRSGLLAITLPSVDGSTKLPARIKDNWISEEPDASFALYRGYPRSAAGLRATIEEAFTARTEKSDLVDNSRTLRVRDSACP